jgi:DnaK suppressor protein
MRDGIRVSLEPDQLDNTTLAVERDIASADIERRSTLVREIADALMRLDAGEYGMCVACGSEIPAVRMHWVPWTRYCVRCQKANESER